MPCLRLHHLPQRWFRRCWKGAQPCADCIASDWLVTHVLCTIRCSQAALNTSMNCKRLLQSTRTITLTLTRLKCHLTTSITGSLSLSDRLLSLSDEFWKLRQYDWSRSTRTIDSCDARPQLLSYVSQPFQVISDSLHSGYRDTCGTMYKHPDMAQYSIWKFLK
jgi:hypothetical protein